MHDLIGVMAHEFLGMEEICSRERLAPPDGGKEDIDHLPLDNHQFGTTFVPLTLVMDMDRLVLVRVEEHDNAEILEQLGRSPPEGEK